MHSILSIFVAVTLFVCPLAVRADTPVSSGVRGRGNANNIYGIRGGKNLFGTHRSSERKNSHSKEGKDAAATAPSTPQTMEEFGEQRAQPRLDASAHTRSRYQPRPEKEAPHDPALSGLD